MDPHFLKHLKNQLQEIQQEGLWKQEAIISSDQKSHVSLENDKKVINFCANNYLGLSNHPKLIQAAKDTLDQYGYGLSSVRFICGTQSIHKKLEKKISQFLETEDTILYSSCFDANGGLFETLLTKEDAIISDSLNHASIIDGVRLCKAMRFRYKNNDMQDLERRLEEAQNARFRLIVTDGVFSMDGIVANLKDICDLADRYQALVMVDDSHATGFMGEGGRGSIEDQKVMGRVDIITGTLGKALGGASGGYTSGRREIIDILRQRSRPYLFSNTLAPSIVGASLAVFELIEDNSQLLKTLKSNTLYFRKQMKELGFKIIEGKHPIVPVMLGCAKLSQEFAKKMFERGIYVVSFSYPVVPRDQARIRVQISAAHSQEDLDKAISTFKQVGQSLAVI